MTLSGAEASLLEPLLAAWQLPERWTLSWDGLEEVYLNGNDAARRYIPHAPFRPFRDAWAELARALG